MIKSIVINTVFYIIKVFICFNVRWQKTCRIINLFIKNPCNFSVCLFCRSYKYLERKCVYNFLCFWIYINNPRIKNTSIAETFRNFSVYILKVIIQIKKSLCLLYNLNIFKSSILCIKKWSNFTLCDLACKCINTTFNNVYLRSRCCVAFYFVIIFIKANYRRIFYVCQGSIRCVIIAPVVSVIFSKSVRIKAF